MKCVFYGGETKKMLVTFSYEEEDRYFLVEHVPAEVCERCGEKTYSPDVTDELLKFAKDKFGKLELSADSQSRPYSWFQCC